MGDGRGVGEDDDEGVAVALDEEDEEDDVGVALDEEDEEDVEVASDEAL